MDLLLNPRYKDKPVYLFFENYVLDCIGHLPEEKQLLLNDLNLQLIFKTQSNTWKAVVKEVLQLSSTIELAIRYEWYTLLEQCDAQNLIADSDQFAIDFADAYFSEDSPIDVWDEQSLMNAEAFVRKCQLQETEEA